MQTGRNQPCPCGSGKKYKHCCINNQQQPKPSANIHNPPMTAPFRDPQNHTPISQFVHPNILSAKDDVEDDLGFDDDDFDNDADVKLSLLSALNDMMYDLRNLKLRKLSHIKEYKKLRKIHSDIITAMAIYVNEGKFTHKFDREMALTLTDESRRISSNKHEKVRYIDACYNLSTPEGESAYYDMFMYKCAVNANSITEEFITTKRYRKPEKIAMLQAMHDSVWGLFKITAIDEKEAYVSLQEVFTGQEFKIVDIGMSMRDSVIDSYIHRRIITVQDISFSTGAALTYEADDPFILDFIKRHKEDYLPYGEMIRFNELYNHYTANSEKIMTQVYGVR